MHSEIICKDDDRTIAPISHIDDEYAMAGVADPRVCVTTSHDPSSRMKQFVKEVRLLFPNAQRINRGQTKINELVEVCRTNGFTDLIIVHETRGEPDSMIISHLPYGPTAYFSLSNCVFRHDIPNSAPMSEVYPHVILENFSTPLGLRIGNVLKHLFPVPKPESKRIVTFANREDQISFRHHVYKKGSEGPKDIDLEECGPRFEMKLYQLRLGTLDQDEAEMEWVLRPYMNTHKSKYIL